MKKQKKSNMPFLILLGVIVIGIIVGIYLVWKVVESDFTNPDYELNEKMKCVNLNLAISYSDSDKDSVFIKRNSGGVSEPVFAKIFVNGELVAETNEGLRERGVKEFFLKDLGSDYDIQQGDKVQIAGFFGDFICSMTEPEEVL
jgi:hypothetical protein